jgi:hypothetical protein
MEKKILAVSIVVLFIGVGIRSAFAINLNISTNIIKEKETAELIEIDSNGLSLGIYRNCEINGYHYGMIPRFVRLFAPVIFNDNFAFESCTLDGDKGKISVSRIIGICFFGTSDMWIPRDGPSLIKGRLLFCIYN